jgi:hypothetical protein
MAARHFFVAFGFPVMGIRCGCFIGLGFPSFFRKDCKVSVEKCLWHHAPFCPAAKISIA